MVNMKNLELALTLMWQGMLGIFIVMSVIALIVYFCTKFSKQK